MSLNGLELELSSLLPLASTALILTFGSGLDARLLISILLFKKWTYIQTFALTYLDPPSVLAAVSALVTISILSQVYSFAQGLQVLTTFPSNDKFIAKPLLFPCKTNHVRIFPKKHGFNYSFLWAGIPVGWSGNHAGMISVDETPTSSSWATRLWQPWSAWYAVNGDNYLFRGHVAGGLKEKLENYLTSQGINCTQYKYAYLLTAAKFLGYSSNPVSIWHLYSESKVLTAVILEVNNTFDERHSYFLSPASKPSLDENKPPRLSGVWPKDFYVSPFNARSGTYSLSATDPLYFEDRPDINATITLSSSQNHPKLIARISSAGPALDPAKMSVWEKVRFLLGWWWVGFATFPRTVVQAYKLMFKRKLPWATRPEPGRDTVSRHATETERVIEHRFREFLKVAVEDAKGAVTLRYAPAGLVDGEAAEEVMTSSPAQLLPMGDYARDISIRVLSPSFYSSLILYSHPGTALRVQSMPHTATVIISDPLDLPGFSTPSSQQGSDPSNTLRQQILLALITRLRRNPTSLAPKLECAETIVHPPKGAVSLLDTFASPNKTAYLELVVKTLAVDRVTGGVPELLDLGFWIGKILLIWRVASWFTI